MKTIRFSLRSALGITLMAAAILAVSSSTVHAQLSVWNLRNDFSLTGSPTAGESDGIGPDGAWSYHVDDGGSEVLFNATGESRFAGSDLATPTTDNLWTSSTITGADQNNLWVSKAEIPGSDPTSSGLPANNFDYLADEITISSFAPNRNVILRWTAPSDMQVDVEGIVWGAHVGPNRPTSFDITHTDSSGTPVGGGVGNVVPNTSYIGSDTRAQGHPFGGFTDLTNHPAGLPSSPIQLSVSAGDRLDLKNYVIGADGTISGVELIVSEVPEPATCILAVLGAVGLLGCRRWLPKRSA